MSCLVEILVRWRYNGIIMGKACLRNLRFANDITTAYDIRAKEGKFKSRKKKLKISLSVMTKSNK